MLETEENGVDPGWGLDGVVLSFVFFDQHSENLEPVEGGAAGLGSPEATHLRQGCAVVFFGADGLDLHGQILVASILSYSA